MKQFNLDKILEYLNVGVIYNLVQYNYILKEKLTEEELQASIDCANKVNDLLGNLKGHESIDYQIKLREKSKKIQKEFLESIEKKIDPNKFMTVALYDSIKMYNEFRNLMKKDNIGVALNEIEFAKALEEMRDFLEEKDIKMAVQNEDGKMEFISSINLCALDIKKSNGEKFGEERKQSRRKKIKEDQDRKTNCRIKENEDRLSKIDNKLLEKILKEMLVADFLYISNENIDEWLMEELVDRFVFNSSVKLEEIKITGENWEKIHGAPDFIDKMKKMLEDYLGYIDLDKFFLVAAYRNIQSIDKTEEEDNEEKRKQSLEEKEELLTYISEKLIKNKNTNCKLEARPEKGEGKSVTYKVKDLKRDINRFLPSGIYASEELMNGTREKIFNGEKKLNDIDRDLLKFMRLSKKEIVEYSIICEENFLFVLDNYQLSTETIKEILSNSFNISNKVIDKLLKENKITREDLIELFVMGKISIECIHGYITNEEITELYENKKISTEQLITFFHYGDIDTETMGALIVLYGIEKEMIEALDNKTIEMSEIKPLSEAEAMYALDEEYIFSRYTDKNEENNFKTLEPLYWGFQNGKLSVEELDELYREGIVKEEDLYEASLKGYFSKEKIEELYLRSLISDEILDDLSENNIISKNFAKSVKSKLKIDKIQGSFPFTGKIETIDINGAILIPPDSKIERQEGTGKTSNSKKGKGIDPQFKIDVLANLPVGIKKIPEESLAYEQDNPFYNYEFFVIPEKNGELTEDSIVIAEKLYTSRSKRTTWAYGDATYIFKLKDFKRISKKSKKEIQEFMKATEVKDVGNYNAYDGTERVVHRSMFYWSTELGKRISKMLGKSKTSIYTEEELEEIKNSPLEINEFYQDR